jgi:hypothetical protein
MRHKIPPYRPLPADPHQAAFDKTVQIFQELCPAHYSNLLDPSSPKSFKVGNDLAARVTRIFSKRFGPETAREYATHVTGFPADAAFLVALLLYPDRFTDDEVAAGVGCFGIEASLHGPPIARILDFPNTN